MDGFVKVGNRNRLEREHHASYRKYASGVVRARKYKQKTAFTFAQFHEWFEAHRHDICECGARATSIDHVMPLFRGGTHALENFQMLCKSCNSRKGAWLAGEMRVYPWQKPGWQKSLGLRSRPELGHTFNAAGFSVTVQDIL